LHVVLLTADGSGQFDLKTAIRNVHRDLSAKYPGHILPASDLQWVLFNSGGLVRSVCVLHASITELVVIVGSAVDATGNTGFRVLHFKLIIATFSVCVQRDCHNLSTVSGQDCNFLTEILLFCRDGQAEWPGKYCHKSSTNWSRCSFTLLM